ncbi:MAG: nuclear transport factor 2 family protein [Selenomonadaceae bacterium]|nr:nuclear transport factor 2 family protein [Selenomonadaceae bacterium]
MNDKKIVENIVKEIAKSFSGAESTKNWTKETIWFDAAPYASVGAEKAKKVFDEAFDNLKSCNVTILDMRTFINENSALVCSVQKWDTVNKDVSVNPPFMMRQTDYLEKRNGEWKVLHEHTSAAQDWNGKIDE